MSSSRSSEQPDFRSEVDCLNPAVRCCQGGDLQGGEGRCGDAGCRGGLHLSGHSVRMWANPQVRHFPSSPIATLSFQERNGAMSHQRFCFLPGSPACYMCHAKIRLCRGIPPADCHILQNPTLVVVAAAACGLENQVFLAIHLQIFWNASEPKMPGVLVPHLQN